MSLGAVEMNVTVGKKKKNQHYPVSWIFEGKQYRTTFYYRDGNYVPWNVKPGLERITDEVVRIIKEREGSRVPGRQPLIANDPLTLADAYAHELLLKQMGVTD